MTTFTAAVVQAAPVVFDAERTLEKLREAFVSAYPKGLDFGARVGMRAPEGRDDFRRYFESSIEVPGPATEAIGAAAHAGGLHLVVGPLGRVLAGPDFEGETILTAEIDTDEIARGKYHFDVVGHYARPDVFRLHVNERAMPAVVSAVSGTADPFDEN